MSKERYITGCLNVGNPDLSNNGDGSLNTNDAYINGVKINKPNDINIVNDNILINGDFNIWQRGTNFNTTGSNLYFTADRTCIYPGTGTTATVSRQEFALGQTDVPNNPRYFLRVNRTVTGSEKLEIRLPINDVRILTNKIITVSVYLKASANTVLESRFVQNFGTGGSPSSQESELVDDNIEVSTSWNLYTISIIVPSISGKTLGSDDNSFSLFCIDIPNSAGNISVDISNIKIEFGNINTKFVSLKPQEQLYECKKYYQRISSTVSNERISNGSVQAATNVIANIILKVRMIKTPVVSISSASHLTLQTTGASFVASAINITNINPQSCTLSLTISGATAGRFGEIYFNNINAYIEFKSEVYNV